MATAVPSVDATELFSDKSDAEDVRELSLEDVLESPYQTRQRRITRESVSDLMSSIAAAGQLQPIIASSADDEHPGKYFVHAGHRRCAALRYLGIHKVRAHVRRLTPVEARKIVFCENQGREDVSAVELSEAISQYAQERGCDFSEAARELGVQGRTRKRLALLSGLEPALRDAFVEFGISSRVGELLVRLDKIQPGLGLRRATAFRSGRVTIAKLESELQQLRDGGKRAAPVSAYQRAVSCELEKTKMRLRIRLDSFDPDEPDVREAVDSMKRCLSALESSFGGFTSEGPQGPGPGGPAAF